MNDADAILAQPRYIYGPDLDEDRDLAMEALYGGRRVTAALGRKLTLLRNVITDPETATSVSAQQRINEVWKYSIDPAYSSWRAISEQARRDEAAHYSFVPDSRLSYAEAMLDWPIYRAAVLAQQRDVIDASGHSTMRGLSSETLDVLDQLGSSEPR